MHSDTETPPERVRLSSLDALRGMDMFLIQGGELLFPALFALTGWYGWKIAESQMIHSPWHGFTFYDLIFPLFIFVSGAAVGISYKRIDKLPFSERLPVYSKAIKRLFLLCILGIVFNHGFGQGIPVSLSEIRFASVLGRIGIACFLASMLAWHTSTRVQCVTAVTILIGYWLWLCFIPVPDSSGDPLSPEGSWNAWIDQHFLPGVTYMGKPYDPEGLLSNLPSMVNASLGILAGQLLRQKASGNDWQAASILLGAGTIAIVSGWLWDPLFPVNKDLWTSSFVLVTAGWSSVLLACVYVFFDILKWRKIAFPLVLFGANSILIYMSASLIDWTYITTNLFGGLITVLPDIWQPLMGILALLTVKLIFLHWLYQKKVFLRV